MKSINAEQNSIARNNIINRGFDESRIPEAIRAALHAEFVPIWALTPGLRARHDVDGFAVLSNEGQHLVTIPWVDVPVMGA